MEYLLVVYFLTSGDWVSGDELDGWAPIAYPTQELCLERKARAEEIQADLERDNPRAYPKRDVCEPRQSGADG